MINSSKPRWVAIVDERAIPMPRQIVSAQLIREQAALSADTILIRDHQSPVDQPLAQDEAVDLAKGNVFRSASTCEVPTSGEAGPAKLGFVVDDKIQYAVEPKQTEASLRRLFDLHPRKQLLRDMEGPNDTPIQTNETIRFADGPLFITVVELESHCKDGDSPPECGGYMIRVDDKKLVVRQATPTGREILILAGKNPAVTMLNMKIGRAFQPIALDQKVDLTACGIERFTTLPNEQAEGRPDMKEFLLPEEDVELLDGSNLEWETIVDGSKQKWLIVHHIALPDVFVPAATSMAIQLPAGYPATALDMAYFYNPIRRRDGATIPCTESSVNLRGVEWQRWSRHYTPANPWIPGVYNVLTHYLLALEWLKRESNRGR